MKCPRSLLTTFLRDACVVIRRWRNSWWKCRRRPLLSLLRRHGGPAGGSAADRASACLVSRFQISGPAGGLLVEVGHLPHPVGPTTGQGGIQILAAATVADVAAVDVPVNMQHKFQQSLVLIQFINRVVVIPVATQRQVRTVLLCRRPLRFHSCSSWTSLSCPFCAMTSFGIDSAENCGISAGAALWCC